MFGQGPEADRFLRAIFPDQITSGLIHLSTPYASGALTWAQGSLLMHPERPVALVLCSETEDRRAIITMKDAAQRVLASGKPTGWHVAMAVPRLDAWVMVDPRIREAFEADELTRDPQNYYGRSLKIGELTKDKPFDVALLRQESAEFQGLEEFLERQLRAPKVKPKARLF
jgi:hypothetical protein